MLNVVVLSAIMLNVVMQSVVILNVVAPIQHPVYFEKKILARIIFVKYFGVNTCK